MKKHIKSLLFGNTVLLPEYDMSGTAIRRDNVKPAYPSKIIISEGLFTLTDKVVDAFDFKIYVDVSHDIQKERFSNENIEFNSQMNEKHVKKYCRLGQAEKRIMETAFERLNLTVRGYHKVLKTARTIADIEGEECINAGHLSEAFSYRNPL